MCLWLQIFVVIFGHVPQNGHEIYQILSLKLMPTLIFNSIINPKHSFFAHCVKNNKDMSKIPQCSSLQPKYKITLAQQVSSFFRAHPSTSCGISRQDTFFLFCLCVYLPINASQCLDSQCIAYINTKISTKHMTCTQPSDIYRNHCTHSGIIRHSHGMSHHSAQLVVP